MTPLDTKTVFEGWNEAHEGPKPGADAMTKSEYQDLVRQVDGN